MYVRKSYGDRRKGDEVGADMQIVRSGLEQSLTRHRTAALQRSGLLHGAVMSAAASARSFAQPRQSGRPAAVAPPPPRFPLYRGRGGRRADSGNGNNLNVAIDSRVKADIWRRLKDFQSDPALLSLAFPASLSSQDRKYVHKIAVNMSMKTKSQGSKTDGSRFVVVHKTRAGQAGAGEGGEAALRAAAVLSLPPAVRTLVDAFLQRHPLGTIQHFDPLHMRTQPSAAAQPQQQQPQAAQRPTPPPAPQPAALPSSSSSSRPHRPAYLNNPRYRAMLPARQRLPISSQRAAIVELYAANQVIVISGETGSGKCFAAGTRLRLQDGGCVAVERVKGGERLMGDDGAARIVTAGSCTRGRAALFRIEPSWTGAEAFTVNAQHILVLVNACRPYAAFDSQRSLWQARWFELDTGNEMRQRSADCGDEQEAKAEVRRRLQLFSPLEWEVSVEQFLRAPAEVREACCLFQSGPVSFRSSLPRLQQNLCQLLGTDVSRPQLDWAAWYLGLSVSGSSCRQPDAASASAAAVRNAAIASRLLQYPALFGESVQQPVNRQLVSLRPAPLLSFGAGTIAQRLLDRYGLHDNEPSLLLPPAWLCDSIEVRCSILAGVLDGAGAEVGEDECELNVRQHGVAADLKLLAASLGIRSSCSSAEDAGDVRPSAAVSGPWRVRFGGDLGGVLQQRAVEPPRSSPAKGDSSSGGGIESRSFEFRIAALPEDDYYGFAVHGGRNRRFLLSDLTVSHNSTQVPQFILEHLDASSPPFAPSSAFSPDIICTQPRRISAVSLAERVAMERGEEVGGTVGYQIRLERVASANTRILFCTVGILLRRLASDPTLRSVRTLIVDECHERERNCDFLLNLVRSLLPQRPELRLVLMSATINAELFSQYFQARHIFCPGFTFPVETFHLADVLELTGYQEQAAGGGSSRSRAMTGKKEAELRTRLQEMMERQLFEEEKDRADAAAGGDEQPTADSGQELTPEAALQLLDKRRQERMRPIGWVDTYVFQPTYDATALAAPPPAASEGSAADEAKLMSMLTSITAAAADTATSAQPSTAASSSAGRYQSARVEHSAATLAAIARLEADGLDYIDYGLVVATIHYICTAFSSRSPAVSRHGNRRRLQSASVSASACDVSVDNGAILVFLPGWEDINRVMAELQSHPHFAASPAAYSILPLHGSIPSSEQRRIFSPPQAGVRKIVLATNVAETSITIDDVVFVLDSGKMKEKTYDPYSRMSSLASGWISQANAQQRAGRAGRSRPGVCLRLYTQAMYDKMDAFQTPELLRTPLEEVCLQIKLLQLKDVASFLSDCLQPPAPVAVRTALELLVNLGALTAKEELTELGEYLAALPLDPRLGKMILYGAAFQCLDPSQTAVCSDCIDPHPHCADAESCLCAVLQS